MTETITDISPTPQPAWPLAYRVAFRFATLLLVFNAAWGQVRTQMGGLVGNVLYPVEASVSAALGWINAHVFDVDGVSLTSDSHTGWVSQGSTIILAAVATVLWSVTDRRRTNYERLLSWVRLLVRFALAATLLYYGFAKFTGAQFGTRPLRHLVTPIGDFAPPALMWFFFGASPVFRAFSAVAEVLAGSLLLFRRTTLAGALLAVAVTTNVLVMNISSFVAVQHLAWRLLVMALFLVAPDVPRLFAMFFKASAVAAGRDWRLFARARWDTWTRWLGMLYALYLIVSIPQGQVQLVASMLRAGPESQLTGVYAVDAFRRNGVDAAASDTTRWEYMSIEGSGLVTIRFPGGRVRSYLSVVDTASSQFVLGDPPGNSDPRFNASLHFRPLPKNNVTATLEKLPDERRHPYTFRRGVKGELSLETAASEGGAQIVLRRMPQEDFLINRWRSIGFKGNPNGTWVTAPFATPDR